MTAGLSKEFEKKLVIPVAPAFLGELDGVVKGIVSNLDIQTVEELSNTIVLNDPSELVHTIVDTQYRDLYDKDLNLCNIGYVWISAVVLYETIVGESASALTEKRKMLYALALRNAIVAQHNSLENIAFPVLVEEIIGYWITNSSKLQVELTDYDVLLNDILEGRVDSVNCQESVIQAALKSLAIKAAYADFADFAGSENVQSIENPFARLFVIAFNMVKVYYWPLQSEKIAKVLKQYVPLVGRKVLKAADMEVLRDYVDVNDIKFAESVGKTSWLLRMIQGDCGEYTSTIRMDAYAFGVYVFYELIYEKLKSKLAV